MAVQALVINNQGDSQFHFDGAGWRVGAPAGAGRSAPLCATTEYNGSPGRAGYEKVTEAYCGSDFLMKIDLIS